MLKFSLAEIAEIGLGAGLGVALARYIGLLYREEPMIQPHLPAYLAPSIVGFFLIAVRYRAIKRIGMGMVAYGVGKLVYNWIIQKWEGE